MLSFARFMNFFISFHFINMIHKEEIFTDSYRDFINSRSLYQLHRELKSLENTRAFDILEAERKI